MKTKREALAEQGLAIAGARGKFSKAANAWLDAQRAAGVKFSDDDKPVKSTGPKPEPVAKTVTPGDSPYISPSDYRFPEDTYDAFYRKNGKKVRVSLRECCNTCRVSLVNHGCDSPTIHGSISVTIEMR